MPEDKPLFLLTNDDGVHASGIRKLAAALRPHARVVIVAPESDQSATSHTLSLHRPLRIRKLDEDVFAVDGTPADCVYIALHAEGKALPKKPALVVSGLNHGVNLGADAFYSGTIGGAREAALRGIPALAASADTDANREAACSLARDVALGLLATAGGKGALFSLNVPPGNGPWKLRATVLGSRLYTEQVVFAKDPRGREYMWIGGAPVSHGDVPGSDTEAFDEGVASLTPLVLDLTSRDDAALAGALVSSVATV